MTVLPQDTINSEDTMLRELELFQKPLEYERLAGSTSDTYQRIPRLSSQHKMPMILIGAHPSPME